MARPREFIDKEVMDAAVSCFWRHGLEATSVRDLAAEMGINGPSLYNAYGSKRELFARALEHYAINSVRPRLARLEQSHTPKAAISAFFSELISRSLSDPEHRGCLLVNSAIEVAPHDDHLRVVIATYLAEIENAFRRCLKNASAATEIPQTIVPRDAARMLLGLLLGIRVMARAKPERAVLVGMVRSALSLLDHPHRRPS